MSADTLVPGVRALKPLTIDFHETGFVAQIAGENGQPFWFQLSGEQQQESGSPWGPANPQGLNRYSYVLNNPLGATDPSGHAFRIRMKEVESRRLSKRQRSLSSHLRAILIEVHRVRPQRHTERMVHPNKFESMAQMGILSTMMTMTMIMAKEDPIDNHGDVQKMALLQKKGIALQASQYLLLPLTTIVRVFRVSLRYLRQI